MRRGETAGYTLLSRALEGSRAAKWAPRKGAPKGEAPEEEEEVEEDDDDDDDEEDEDKEVEGRGGWRGQQHHPLYLLPQPSFASPTCLPAIF